jgi:hypothetical protein
MKKKLRDRVTRAERQTQRPSAACTEFGSTKSLRGTWSAWSAVLGEYFILQPYNYFFGLKNSLLSLKYNPFFDLFSSQSMRYFGPTPFNEV